MKKILVTIVLACFCALPVPAQETDANLVDAVTLYTNGENKQARRLLHTLSVAQPGNDAVWYYLALSAVRDADLEAATQACEKAVALDSTNYWYRHLQARLQVIQKQPQKGIEL